MRFSSCVVYVKTISAATGAQVYFARPYLAWERGTNENTNGLIREFIQKGIDFDRLSDRDLFEIQMGLNARQRKCLAFRPLLNNDIH